jgi:4-amino-4-deoxy-L-arabinose transferase-like glycosyltransferase
VFQILVLQNYPHHAGWITALTLTLWLAGMAGMAALALSTRKIQAWLSRAALGVALAALLVAPAVWSGQTTFSSRPEVGLPRAGASDRPAGKADNAAELSPEQQALLSYLLENTEPDSYLLAVFNSHQASPYILATGRPVLTFGGFTGRDDVISAEQLAQMVTAGEMRFVLDSGLQREKPEIAAWLRDRCTVVSLPGATGSTAVGGQRSGPDGSGPGGMLYDCGTL